MRREQSSLGTAFELVYYHEQLFDLTGLEIYIKLQAMKREKSANSLPYLLLIYKKSNRMRQILVIPINNRH